MSGLIDTPIERNFLLSHNFKIFFKKLPYTSFFCTGAHVPGMSAGVATYPTPTLALPLTGDHPSYEHFIIEFKVDEDLTNWIEILKWMRGDTFPETTEEYKRLFDNKSPEMGLEADALIWILDAKKNPKVEITYFNSKPIAVSGFDFNVNRTDTEVVTAQATFTFDTFDVQPII
jgi:hypothetical protein